MTTTIPKRAEEWVAFVDEITGRVVFEWKHGRVEVRRS